MYEREHGAKRIAFALYRCKENPAAIQRMANVLNYESNQLKEDIQALHDRLAELEVMTNPDLFDECVDLLTS